MELAAFLEDGNLSAAEFGRQIDVSRVTVRRYARGLRVPAPRIMRRIMDATGGLVTANDFHSCSDGPTRGDAA